MLKSLFEHFQILYQDILARNPTLAAEHALRQEDEVYQKVSKITYRHVRTQSAPSITRRRLNSCRRSYPA